MSTGKLAPIKKVRTLVLLIEWWVWGRELEVNPWVMRWALIFLLEVFRLNALGYGVTQEELDENDNRVIEKEGLLVKKLQARACSL